jgi:hypothetical protein
MADINKKIGLSLGADLCWPAAYEALLAQLKLSIPVGDDVVRFSTERVMVEPFNLRYNPSYDVVLDRLTHWFHTSREWIKKIAIMDGVYILNNPWSIQSIEKHTSYCAMIRLGMPIPDTWMLPPKEYTDEGDTRVTVQRYNKLFQLSRVGEAVGYPAFLKPYDGGGWVGVKRVTDAASLQAAYDASGTRVNHLQAAVKDWDIFIRALGVGPQVNIIRYDPDAPLHARYMVDFHYLDGEEWLRATRICRTINAFCGWDFNSCEMLRSAGVLHPIDYANACPDSQVTSLHYHFPWLVKALLRWSIFCAATGRKMRLNMDWERFFAACDPDKSFEERLVDYDAIAREHFDTERFDEFSQTHLAHLDEVALEYFTSPGFRDVVRAKVAALYPDHEIEQFTDHFYGLIQFWGKTEADRLNAKGG